MIDSNAVNKHLVTGYSYIHPELHITDSPIQGKGIFTQIRLLQQTVVFEIVAEKIHYTNNPTLAGENPNWIGAGFQEWLKIGPGDIAGYLNHSCNPNVILNEKSQLITIKPVQAHEELVMDYSTTELDPYWEMDCKCQASDCRKLLRSFQFLPDDLKIKYQQYLAPVFVNLSESMLHQGYPDYYPGKLEK